MTGPFRCDIFPHSRWVFRQLQDERNVRQLTLMCSAQVIKTTMAVAYLLWSVVESPATTFFVMQTEESVKNFVKSRLMPLLYRQTILEKYLPTTRNEATELLIQFKSMQVHFRGTNSRGGLKSTAVQRVIGDEIDEWSAGAYERVSKRLTTFFHPQFFLLSTPENEDGVTYREFLQGTQTQFHFACPACQHRQPFRFGRNATPVFPAARDCGGFLWDTNETTKPMGRWNDAELAKSVRYQCENPACKREIPQTEHFKLLQDLQPVDMNANPASGKKSAHIWTAYNALYPWSDLVKEFVHAESAMQRGDQEPLKSYVRERLGEPWVEHSIVSTEDEIRRLCGQYNIGELWPAKEGTRQAVTMTIDVQQDKLRWAVFQHRQGGAMRLVDYGWAADFAEAKRTQTRYGVGGNGVFIDAGDGNRSAEIYAVCGEYRWKACKGDDAQGWEHTAPNGIKIMKPWRQRAISMSEGASVKGSLAFFNWSNPTIKSRLYKFALKGKGAGLELPRNISQDAIEELIDDQLMKDKTSGKWKWKSSGNEHLGDCFCMAVVQADFFGFTGLAASVPTETEAEKE